MLCASKYLLSLLVLFSCAAPSTAQSSYTVETAPEWTNLFDTTSGWTGADGIFSFPLDGNDSPGGLQRAGSLFVFSDTFIGDVSPTGQRSNTSMVNNTMGFLPRNGLSQGVDFYWDATGPQPASIFTPNTPLSQPDDWYWFSDGVVIGDKFHLLANRMEHNNGPPGWNFARAGMSLFTMNVNGPYTRAAAVEVDTPLSIPESPSRGGGFFGAGIMANTVEAGAPSPDGYIYVYGSQEDQVKKLMVARVLPQNFENFNTWRFWDGSGWSPDVNASATLTGRISNELSVTPMPDGRFACIFSLDTLSGKIGMKIAPTPWGPFGNVEVIYDIPTPPIADAYTYNAKAHPHLSEPGELLISYNANTFEFWDHFTYADIYRPRFIKLTWQ
jgi:hypothetical protein